jgi:hypothetical protein
VTADEFRSLSTGKGVNAPVTFFAPDAEKATLYANGARLGATSYRSTPRTPTRPAPAGLFHVSCSWNRS